MADEGFKIAGAYVEVNLKDSTEADEQRIRARLEAVKPVEFETALKAPENLELVRERIKAIGPVNVEVKANPDLASAAAAGTEIAKWTDAAVIGARSKIEASPPVRIRTDADTTLAQAKIRELAASRNAAIITIDADITKARSRIADLEAKRGNTKLDVDAEIGKAQAKIEALQTKKNRILLQIEVDQASLRRVSDQVESETSKMAKRANAQFSALQFAALFAGVPAAAAVAGAGIAVGFAAVPAVFAGIAAASSASNTQVVTAWSGTAAHLKTLAQGWAQPFADSFVDAAHQVQSRADVLSPMIAQTFRNSVPVVKELTGGVLDLATSAMPGLLVATQNLRGPISGVNQLLTQVGHGFSDFFTNLSGGAMASQGIMVTLGGVFKDLLGFAGSLFANLANSGGPALNQFRTALSQVESTVLTLTSSTSALYPAIGGFLTTVSGGLSIVQGFASAMGVLPASLSSTAGSLLATNKIASLFGTSLTSTGFGLKAFSASVDEAGNRTTPFKQALADTEAGGNKVTRGLSAVVSSGFNPFGLALAAGSLLLEVWGQKSQDAAQRAAEQRKAVDDLTTAFQKDNGAIGANVTATASKALADQHAFENAKVFGASMADVSRAGLGQADAMGSIVTQAKEYAITLLSGNRANQQMIPTVLQTVDAFARQGGNAADTVDKLRSFRAHSLDLSDAQARLLVNTLDGVAAVGEEGRATLAAAAKQAALQAALDRTAQVLHDQTTPGMYAAQVATADLKAVFDALNTAGGDVVAKGKAIIAVLDQLSGKQMSAEESLQAFNDQIRDLAKNMQQAESDGSRFNKKMIDASGAIDTTTEAGSKLQNVVQGAAADMASYGQALKDAGVPSDQIIAKLGTMRDRLADQLKQLGLTPPEIDKVLAHAQALPSDIAMALHLEGAPEAQAAITGIVTQLKEVPENKGVHVSALTTEAQAALVLLGYHIVQLPNGTFQVFANTAPGDKAADEFAARNFGRQIVMVLDANATPANGKITATVQKADGSLGTMTMDARTDPASGKLQVMVQTVNGSRGWMTVDAFNDAAKSVIGNTVRVANDARGFVQVAANAGAANAAIDYAARNRVTMIHVVTDTGYRNIGIGTGAYGSMQAEGSVLSPMARGGVLRFAGGGQALTPMQPIAQVVPPDTWRVVGDNLRVPEAYIPLDRSARSQSILDEANTAMGRGSTAVMAPQVHVTVNGYQHPVDDIVDRVVNEVAWALR